MKHEVILVILSSLSRSNRYEYNEFKHRTVFGPPCIFMKSQ